jgi:hypothetical protein
MKTTIGWILSKKKKRLDISSEIVRDVHTMKFKAKANAL